MRPRDIADHLDRHRMELARATTDEHYRRHPSLEQRYGPEGRTHCNQDAAYHLGYLARAVSHESAALFADYVLWARSMLDARNVPSGDLAENLRAMEQVVIDALPHAADRVSSIVGAGIAALGEGQRPPSPVIDASPRAPLARAYLTALLEGSRRAADDLIRSAVQEGLSIADLYLHVFEPAQRELGRLWQMNEITVAQEHFCTAATQTAMAQFYPRILATPRKGLRILLAAVGNELHEMGARMVADFFELDGWDTVYLGANTPATALLEMAASKKPHIVALAVTMTMNLAEAEALISRLKGDPRLQSTIVLVGGYPFHVDRDLWTRIGADGVAFDAAGAVREAQRLVELR